MDSRQLLDAALQLTPEERALIRFLDRHFPDLLFVEHTPVVDGSILGFVQVLDQLRRLPAERVVAGHGRTATPWPQALEPQRRYLELIVTQTRQALKSGKTLEEAVDGVGLEEQEHWVNFESYHRRNVTSAYTELEWED